MDGFNPLLFQITFEGNVEVRRINADEHIGLQFGKTARQIGADVQQTTQATQHLNDAHHRQLFHLIPGFTPFSLHQWTGNADKARVGNARFERSNKTCTKNIAGGFSGDKGDRQRATINH